MLLRGTPAEIQLLEAMRQIAPLRARGNTVLVVAPREMGMPATPAWWQDHIWPGVVTTVLPPEGAATSLPPFDMLVLLAFGDHPALAPAVLGTSALLKPGGTMAVAAPRPWPWTAYTPPWNGGKSVRAWRTSLSKHRWKGLGDSPIGGWCGFAGLITARKPTHAGGILIADPATAPLKPSPAV